MRYCPNGPRDAEGPILLTEVYARLVNAIVSVNVLFIYGKNSESRKDFNISFSLKTCCICFLSLMVLLGTIFNAYSS